MPTLFQKGRREEPERRSGKGTQFLGVPSCSTSEIMLIEICMSDEVHLDAHVLTRAQEGQGPNWLLGTHGPHTKSHEPLFPKPNMLY